MKDWIKQKKSWNNLLDGFRLENWKLLEKVFDNFYFRFVIKEVNYKNDK